MTDDTYLMAYGIWHMAEGKLVMDDGIR